jgi:hypothetical protein
MEGTSGSQILGQAFQIITFGADYGAAEMNIYVCVRVCVCVCACMCMWFLLPLGLKISLITQVAYIRTSSSLQSGLFIYFESS